MTYDVVSRGYSADSKIFMTEERRCLLFVIVS